MVKSTNPFSKFVIDHSNPFTITIFSFCLLAREIVVFYILLFRLFESSLSFFHVLDTAAEEEDSVNSSSD